MGCFDLLPMAPRLPAPCQGLGCFVQCLCLARQLKRSFPVAHWSNCTPSGYCPWACPVGLCSESSLGLAFYQVRMFTRLQETHFCSSNFKATLVHFFPDVLPECVWGASATAGVWGQTKAVNCIVYKIPPASCPMAPRHLA